MTNAYSIRSLKGVGPKIAEHLEQIGITALQDLLFHLPLRYEDRTKITPINTLKPGDRVMIEGRVTSASVLGSYKKQYVVKLEDNTGSITLRFFHFTAQQIKRLSEPDTELRCFGEVRQGYRGGLEMTHPEYRHKEHADDLAISECLTPVYPTTKGLQQATLRKLVQQSFDRLNELNYLDELLPEETTQQWTSHDLKSALEFVHYPPPTASVQLLLDGMHPSQQRLAFEELIAHQLSMQQLRHEIKNDKAISFINAGKLRQTLLDHLPFKLTLAQSRVLQEVLSDLAKPHPMLRLVQGDVGSGKTIVAAMTALSAIESGFQAALMAPTELLAEQHFYNFTQWFEPFGIKIGWLSGRTKGKERESTLEKLMSGEVSMVIGTHALFQEGVQFKQLALMIIDEQHRFGVHQRLAFKEKGMRRDVQPHQLIMTATPIPRTLAMTAYADLDVSVIDEMPPGRKPVNTVLVCNSRRDEILERVRINCENNRQAYWVCTLIEDSEALQAEAAEKTAENLSAVLSNLKVGLLHGRMKPEEKENVMRAFKHREIDLLVATTVIEVGVDVPSASLMIIENAERLGLAQLHQLRGRVGRGTDDSYCVLLYQMPLSETAQERLQIMRETTDGFVVAQKDLEMRGPGELLGTRQAGLMRFRIADLLRDKALIPAAQQVGRTIVTHHPDRVKKLIDRWVVSADKYSRV